MTASIHVNKYWDDGGKTFEMWLKVYGFTIVTNEPEVDVIVIDYGTWKNSFIKYNDDSLIVILSSYNIYHFNIPPNALVEIIPIDYPIVVEHIIEIVKSKKEIV